MLTPVEQAVAAFGTSLDSLIKAVEDGGLEILEDLGLVSVMQSFERVRNRLPLVDHRMIADAQRRDLPNALCQGTLRRVLTSALLVSKGEASRRVLAAEQIGERTSALGQPLPPVRPLLAAAQRTGEVSAEKVVIIAGALGRVDRAGFDPAAIAAGEQLLTQHATTFGPEDLKMLADRVVDAINPDGTLPDDQLQRDRRFFHLRPTRDGAYVGEFRLTGACGAKLAALFGSLAAPRPTGPDGQADPRTQGQRRHDALDDICARLLRRADVPEAGGTPASVIVTIALEDLLAKLGYGRTADGTLLPAQRVLQLARSAEIIPAVLSHGGAVLELGRSRRIATRSQTLALIARDGGCSFPGCAHPPDYCERHHIVEWAAGGETDLDNLTLLCSYHHHNFAARGWTCQLNEDRIPAWTPPRWLDRSRTPLVNVRIHAALLARRC